jgi:hypothetical protein
LYKSHNELQFSLLLQSLGILAQWEDEAKKAIEYLEELTNTEFIIDSKKSQYYPPTVADIEEENKKILQGYYSEDAEADRQRAKIEKEFSDLILDRDKSIKKITDEYEVKKAVLTIGGKRALENCIFYSHTNTLAFNWRKYGDELTTEEIEEILSKIILPEGVKTEIKG